MSHSRRVRWPVVVSVAALAVMVGGEASAQPNPYRTDRAWAKLPEGRKSLGAVANIRPDPDGKHLWVLTRCGSENGCATTGLNLDPILQFDFDGNVVKSFGRGLIMFPHGFFVDREGNVYVTEGAPAADDRAKPGLKLGKGFQVYKFSPDGKVLMTLGTAGVPGEDQTHFNGVSGVAVAANGDIWVVDGHRFGNNRMVRFSKDGKFIQQWGGGVGSESAEQGRFNDPHDINIDSKGQIYVADRGNCRVQVFDKDGKFIKQWTQFGKPSSIFFDGHNNVYVPDGMSDDKWNQGWAKGIRVADATSGWVTAFIPDVDGSSTESVGVDVNGNLYGGQPSFERLIRYVRVRP